MAFELLGGFGAAALVLVSAVSLQNNNSDVVLLSLVGSGLALVPFGVHFGGNLAGGEGDLWAVYLGELLGLAGSAGFIFAANAYGESDATVVFALLAILSPFAGMITGYEISHTSNKEKSKTFSLQPTIQIDKDVKSFGLRLSF